MTAPPEHQLTPSAVDLDDIDIFEAYECLVIEEDGTKHHILQVDPDGSVLETCKCGAWPIWEYGTTCPSCPVD